MTEQSDSQTEVSYYLVQWGDDGLEQLGSYVVSADVGPEMTDEQALAWVRAGLDHYREVEPGFAYEIVRETSVTERVERVERVEASDG